MAAIKQGVLVFRDSGGNRPRMSFEGTGFTALSVVTTLMAALYPYTDCERVRSVYKHSMVHESDAPSVGEHSDTKAIITAMDSDGKIHKWRLPGFNGTPVKTKNGYRVADGDLTTMLTAISTATGLTLTPLESPVIITK